MRIMLLFLTITIAARAQIDYPSWFLLGGGCAKAHCTQREDDAAWKVPPLAGSSGIGAMPVVLSSTGADSPYPYDPTGGSGKAVGCSTNATVVACKSKTTSPNMRVLRRIGRGCDHHLYLVLVVVQPAGLEVPDGADLPVGPVP